VTKAKSVIVTGGASGIGRATALLLGEAGYAVTVADLDAGSAARTAESIIESGGRAQSIGVDVPVESQVAAMVEKPL